MLSQVLIAVLAVALVGVVSYNVGKWAFKKDDQSERVREAFIELATVLKSYGLKDIPDVLIKLAIKDISGAYEIARFYVQLIQKSPGEVVKTFDEVFDRVLAAKLKTPESLAYLKAKIAEHEAAKGETNAA